MMPQQESPSPTTAGQDIPDKLYFRIGEASKLCELPAYVLRFWEGEFFQLKPNKGGSGQRLYRKSDVELILRIKSLLYDQGYTIPGARQIFKAEQTLQESQLNLIPDGPAPRASIVQLSRLRRELADLHAMLSAPARGSATSKPTLRTVPSVTRR
jgi:DNA-binding transcriptional MerR regulator